MVDSTDPHVFLKLCEMSIDNKYELEALGELLEEKGLVTKHEIIARAKALKEQAPPSPHETPFTAIENAVIEQIMAVILQSGLPSPHAQALLKRQSPCWNGARKLRLAPRIRQSFKLRTPHKREVSV